MCSIDTYIRTFLDIIPDIYYSNRGTYVYKRGILFLHMWCVSVNKQYLCAYWATFLWKIFLCVYVMCLVNDTDDKMDNIIPDKYLPQIGVFLNVQYIFAYYRTTL